MPSVLSADQQADFVRRGFSRRNFGRIASVLTAGAALPFYNEPALAQLSMVRNMPADAVKINANENPMGPCAEAADAIHSLVKDGGRYMYEKTYELSETLAGHRRREAELCGSIRRFERSSAPGSSCFLLEGAPVRERRIPATRRASGRQVHRREGRKRAAAKRHLGSRCEGHAGRSAERRALTTSVTRTTRPEH